MTDFSSLARTLDEVSATSSRNKKLQIIADFMMRLSEAEIGPAALFLAGRLFPESDARALSISWKGFLQALRRVLSVEDTEVYQSYQGDIGQAVRRLLEDASRTRQATLIEEPLTIRSVHADLSRIVQATGTGSRREKEALLARLLTSALPDEARYLTSLVLGDMRTGVSDALVVEAIGRAFGIDSAIVSRAWNVTGDISRVALIAMTRGTAGVAGLEVELNRPMRPMLATQADTLYDLPGPVSDYAFEFKYDGARVQVHKDGESIRIFSRRLSEVTGSMPEIVDEITESVKARRVILDGEVIAVDSDGRPYPFQIVMKRYGRTRDVESKSREIRLLLRVFDVMWLDGTSLIDKPYTERRGLLDGLCDGHCLTESFSTKQQNGLNQYYEESRQLGHEGLVAKRRDSPYQPGMRNKNWFKIKHNLEPFDLVIIAAEWGSGRRNRWLSDYHLGVVDADSGEPMMVGKTFKGLTDEEFEHMTRRLKQISVSEHRGVVTVRPDVVVEVLAAEIQSSPRYKSGMALRFARIVNIREDKSLSDVMTLQEMRKVFDSQFAYKASQRKR